MKSLHKKIGAVALVGMVVAGGCLVSRVKVHADSVGSLVSHKEDADANFYYLFRKAKDKGNFELVEHDYLGRINSKSVYNFNKYKGKSYDLYPRFFSSPENFFSEIENESKRERSGIKLGEVYSGQIGGLLFKFKVLK